jgi:hypothetical protein
MTDVNTCIIRPNITCKDKQCGDGMECCQEPNSKISTCCAKGSCNNKTGLCSGVAKIQCPSYFDDTGGIIEGFFPFTLGRKNRVTTIIFLMVLIITLFILSKQ